MQPTNVIRGTWREGVEPNVVNLTGTAFMEEAGAHTFHIEGANASGAVAFTGDVSALFLCASDAFLRLDGSIVNGAAEVTLDSRCYDVPGRFSIAIYVSDGTVVTCVYAAVGNVYRTSSDAMIDTGEGVPNLNQLMAAYRLCVSATQDAQTAALTAVTYAAQTGKTDAEKASARGNINAADAGLVNALHGLVDYDYGTAVDSSNIAGGQGNPALAMTRNGMLITLNGAVKTNTSSVSYRIKINGTVETSNTGSGSDSWVTPLTTLINGHCYRLIAHTVSGSASVRNDGMFAVFNTGAHSGIGNGWKKGNDYGYDFFYNNGTDGCQIAFSWARTSSESASFSNWVAYVTLEDITGLVREIPAVPVTDGTYTLKATVTNGVPVYEWVSDGGASLLSTPLTLGGESE